MDSQIAAFGSTTQKLAKIKDFVKKHIKWFVAFLLGALLLVSLFMFFVNSNSSTSANTEKASVADPKKTFEINKEYTFPLKDENNIEVGKLKYTIENAQLMDEIIIKGQRATAIEGKTFLIFNLKIVNDLSQPIQINTRDYLRIVIDENEKDLIAPDIHNDPVEIQPISTKFTRVGVPINENFKKIQLKVGEINGEKTTLEINF